MERCTNYGLSVEELQSDRPIKARELLATGRIDRKGFMRMVVASTPSTGFCNTVGTAATMNSLAEVLGMALSVAAAIPGPYRDRQECAYRTGRPPAARA